MERPDQDGIYVKVCRLWLEVFKRYQSIMHKEKSAACRLCRDMCSRCCDMSANPV
jgi:hypothetical protein